MLYPDLTHFIRALEETGELCRIQKEVDPYLEIACISNRVAKLSKDKNKALLFEHVKGSKMPVLMNLFGSEKRISMMAGVGGYQGLTDKLENLLELLQTPRRTLIEKLSALPLLRDLSRFFPRYVKRGACQEERFLEEDINLEALPILTTWPEDAGAFVTMPLVFTKDPEDGKRNCGMYRIQRYDKKKAGFHVHTHHTAAQHLRKAKERGEEQLEVAICIGAAPAIPFSAIAPLPPGFDEMIFAGFLNNAPVNMVPCLTIDQEVPASAEIVLEGYVKVDEKRREGPFGDHTGFYSLADDYWVFHCTAITTRKNPIYHGTVVGPPPQEDNHIAEAIERLFLPLLKQPLPEVVDYHLPFEGVAHNLMLLQIKKEYPGQARKAAHAIWGLGQAMFTKVICVSDEIPAQRPSLSRYAQSLARNLDVQHDLEFVLGPTETLDHATRELHYGSKLVLDLTRPFEAEGRRTPPPTPSDMPSDKVLLEKISQHHPFVKEIFTPWKGENRFLSLVRLDKRLSSEIQNQESEAGAKDTSSLEGGRTRKVVRTFWDCFPELACAQRIILFDHDEDLQDSFRLLWIGLANIDPERDIFFDYSFEDDCGIKKPLRDPRRIAIDCTTKSLKDGFARKWPKIQKYPDDLEQKALELLQSCGLWS